MSHTVYNRRQTDTASKVDILLEELTKEASDKWALFNKFVSSNVREDLEAIVDQDIRSVLMIFSIVENEEKNNVKGLVESFCNADIDQVVEKMSIYITELHRQCNKEIIGASEDGRLAKLRKRSDTTEKLAKVTTPVYKKSKAAKGKRSRGVDLVISCVDEQGLPQTKKWSSLGRKPDILKRIIELNAHYSSSEELRNIVVQEGGRLKGENDEIGEWVISVVNTNGNAVNLDLDATANPEQ
ncbi:hypothetical protein [Marinomonas sp. 2405UD68-3]|uniref:hypothetical protein n=1 Tax=Marinomonas sp. 2405UD68-3 TaxID=3391835 RepID=UPI0039C9D807